MCRCVTVLSNHYVIAYFYSTEGWCRHYWELCIAMHSLHCVQLLLHVISLVDIIASSRYLYCKIETFKLICLFRTRNLWKALVYVRHAWWRVSVMMSASWRKLLLMVFWQMFCNWWVWSLSIYVIFIFNTSTSRLPCYVYIRMRGSYWIIQRSLALTLMSNDLHFYHMYFFVCVSWYFE